MSVNNVIVRIYHFYSPIGIESRTLDTPQIFTTGKNTAEWPPHISFATLFHPKFPSLIARQVLLFLYHADLGIATIVPVDHMVIPSTLW
jgi:hypothetical protein